MRTTEAVFNFQYYLISFSSHWCFFSKKVSFHFSFSQFYSYILQLKITFYSMLQPNPALRLHKAQKLTSNDRRNLQHLKVKLLSPKTQTSCCLQSDFLVFSCTQGKINEAQSGEILAVFPIHLWFETLDVQRQHHTEILRLYFSPHRSEHLL